MRDHQNHIGQFSQATLLPFSVLFAFALSVVVSFFVWKYGIEKTIILLVGAAATAALVGLTIRFWVIYQKEGAEDV